MSCKNKSARKIMKHMNLEFNAVISRNRKKSDELTSILKTDASILSRVGELIKEDSKDNEKTINNIIIRKSFCACVKSNGFALPRKCP